MLHLPGPGRIIQVQTPPSLSCGGGSEKQYELYHVARGVSFPETSKNTRFPVLNECGPVLVGSKITADGDCSHEIKRCLLLGRKVMTNLDSIFKSRDVTLPTKVRLVKAMVFPVVMYGCESWTVKKAEH